MKTKSIVSFLGVLVVLTILVLALSRGSDVQAQEGKKKAPRAAPTITKKLNADFVDNFHASANPKPNRLLALDANSKFPDSVLPDSIQRRVSGTCAAGRSIQVINADGTVSCGDSESAVAAGTWNLTGNAATNPASNFVGTTDNQPVVFRTNNAQRVRINANGNVGIGTAAPAQTLEVNGITSLGAPGSVYGYRLGNAAGPHFPTIGLNAYGTNYQAGSSGYGGIFQFQNGDGKLIYYTGSNVGAGAAHANTARLAIDSNGRVGIGTTSPGFKLDVADRIRLRQGSAQSAGVWFHQNTPNNDRAFIGMSDDSHVGIYGGTGGGWSLVADTTSGNVGIGTTSPNALLSVVKSGAPQPIVQGVPTGLKVGTPSGTIPLALRQNATESGNPALAYFETSSGYLGYLGANAGAFVVGAGANKALAFTVNGSTRAMSIASNGVVGIGTANIAAKLHVRGQPNLEAFRVDRSDGTNALRVTHDGYVGVRLLGNNHGGVCHNGGILSECHSAAEYVPTIDGGLGFPKDTDLVSIATANPYGDAHIPFAVQRSTIACDPNLLGFIADPALGADGIKLNDHYLPLAIYGYFPAKVSTENGAIKRGDPLTSSSKPGYAMKATGACKIIGYALEDATQEGQIQVFANTSESSAPEVARLRGQVDVLTQENSALKRQLRLFEERLDALENDTKVKHGEDGTAENTVAIVP